MTTAQKTDWDKPTTSHEKHEKAGAHGTVKDAEVTPRAGPVVNSGLKAVYVQEGDQIDYTPTAAALKAGDVVDLGTMVGIAVRDIAQNDMGALYVEGVFDVLKYANEAVLVGKLVYWDVGTGTASGTSSYGEATMGVCVKDALATDATIRVKLIPVGA